jgi:hypothetical protein
MQRLATLREDEVEGSERGRRAGGIERETRMERPARQERQEGQRKESTKCINSTGIGRMQKAKLEKRKTKEGIQTGLHADECILKRWKQRRRKAMLRYDEAGKSDGN